MTRILKSFTQTITAGFFTVLPLIVTAVIIIWLAGIIRDYAGPASVFGRLISGIGVKILPGSTIPYGVGAIAVILVLYFVGLVVMSTLRGRVTKFLDKTIGRVPLIGSLYNLTNRFITIVDQKDEVDLKSMSPVWCFFGGEAGAAVLALMPTSELVFLEERPYCGILVPTAPIPVGGGLIFVPNDWIKPAEFGVEALTNIYISMGLTAPQYQAQGPRETPRI